MGHPNNVSKGNFVHQENTSYKLRDIRVIDHYNINDNDGHK